MMANILIFRFEVIHTDKYTALKLACVKRSDRGCYQIQAVNALGDHTASFLVTVTGTYC
jgi:hypothetical protein